MTHKLELEGKVVIVTGGASGIGRAAALALARQGTPAPRRRRYRRRLGDDPAVDARLAAQTPLGRLGTPEDVAEAIVWLCSDASSFVTGHSLVIDGGNIV